MTEPASDSQKTRSSAGSIWGATVLGLVLGLSVGRHLWDALTGAGLGFLLASWKSGVNEIEALRASLARLERRRAENEGRPANPTDPTESSGVGETRPAIDAPSVAETAAVAEPILPPPSPPSSPSPRPPRASVSVAAPMGPSPIERSFDAVRSFFLGGNTVVRVGLLVLLVGITLLAKYAADNALFPIEARLASAALAGLGLVGFGYRQRSARPGFGMSLQGGGIAALYLATFFAFKVYGLVPAGLAFALFVGLAVSTVLLSVLQESEALLVIGSLGGFLAPILSSTGEGNHVALFSYYLLLNLSIAAVAWRQAWRLSALVAFVCTYGIATVWGALRYEPALFRSTEPFVLLFLALFTGVAALHAGRRPPRLRGVVDGTLVFGTPLISILLQAALVRDMELGLALSASGFGLFYASIAIVLFRRAPRAMRPLAEAFVVLAVGFATMAIPFAFDEALTTSVAWALEGAGLYWVGARQARAFPRFAGVVLQAMAALAFWVSVEIDRIDPSGFMPLANGRALSCLSLAFAGLFIARTAWARSATQPPTETKSCQALGIWGLIWWSGGVLAEIDQFVARDDTPAAVLFMIAFTALALETLAARFDWEPGRRLALMSLPAAGFTFLVALDELPQLLAYGGWLVWPLIFGCFFFLWQRQGDRDAGSIGAFRSGALWLLALVGGFALYGLFGVGLGLANDWELAGLGVGLASVLVVGVSMSTREKSPFDRHPEHARVVGLGPIALGCLLTIGILQFLATGDASPIPHLPLLNPTDLTVAWLAIASLHWWRQSKSDLEAAFEVDASRAGGLTVAALAFVALNGLLARAVHQWTGVAFEADALWDSVAMQVTLSIAWTIVGLVGMVVSSRRSQRSLWMGCAALLAVVVLKLFTVDLSQLSTVARIATFLVVGVLLLVLGYISPVPPVPPGEAEPEPPAEPNSASTGVAS